MTFEEWAKNKGYRFNEGDLSHCKSWAQAAWEAALEEAASSCDALAAEQDQDMKMFDDQRYGVYAKKYRRAAAAIRLLKD